MRISSLRVSTRLAIGFAIVVFGAIVLGATGWLGIHRQSLVTNQVLDREVQFARVVDAMRVRVLMLRRFEKDMLLNDNDPAKVRDYKVKWDQNHKALEQLVVSAQTLAATDAERRRLEEFNGAVGAYSRGVEQIESAVLAGQIKSAEAGNKKMEEFKDSIHKTESMLEELFQGATKRAEQVKTTLGQIEREVLVALAIVMVLVLALAVVIAMLIARSVTQPVREAMRVAEAVAKGDLTVTVEVRSQDEIGRLMAALRGTVTQLAAVVGRIKQTSDMVNSASREIAQGNTDLSSRTEQQASALEETSASMQQMTATVSQNADNAKKANELAAQASGVAAKGGEVVKEAVSTMNGITESSKKIADIIGVIDGIAFQTNILALNAAVEAARAGEQGRGFAVVAAEVRTLAQRSAAAAKEIKDLITDSVSKVDAGSRQVNDAGRTMDEIVAAVKKVTGLIAEISAASQEQAQGIEQVSETMTQLEKVTQQNAAMVEEASAAAGSLQEQSQALAGAVGAFKLHEAAPAAAAPKPVVAPRPATPAKKPVEAKTAHAVAAKAAQKKGNGQLHEGWQQF